MLVGKFLLREKFLRFFRSDFFHTLAKLAVPIYWPVRCSCCFSPACGVEEIFVDATVLESAITKDSQSLQLAETATSVARSFANSCACQRPTLV